MPLGACHARLDDASASVSHTRINARFERAAWYKDREGTVLPVVEALKAHTRKDEARVWRKPEFPGEE
jgi:hypothetical protein